MSPPEGGQSHYVTVMIVSWIFLSLQQMCDLKGKYNQ